MNRNDVIEVINGVLHECESPGEMYDSADQIINAIEELIDFGFEDE